MPGMGGDERLYASQKAAFPQLEAPRWILPRKGERLPDYARRFAGQLAGEPVAILGGTSLGGIVAYEMASVLRPRSVVLLGSVSARESLPFWLRAALSAGRRVPGPVVKRVALLPPAVHLLGPRGHRDRVLFAAMLRDSDARFLAWAIRALSDWRTPASPACRIVAIHGDRDYIFPPWLVHADHLLPGAGHLLTLSHPEEVNAHLRALLEAEQ